ncbi:MAG: glutamate--cysteine ligase [Pseudanabaenaceae cyanobacterium SKYGB_i_bin29]|nr:glutamate--cysteine ligase [Pseudanabaenaceae cyanobacterium SKYG29]MDW8420372.1 glutamate--cysteine ligase [Pseudanabaenaceae cyanobacterium SKYGB_i_bin29]
MLLTKGFEVEVYTGTPQGQVVGFSSLIVSRLPGFVREPDNRNVEYTTPPLGRYEQLLPALVMPRQQLRQFLATQGDYTLLPGSTMALGGSDHFERSDPQNPYHSYIEQTYGTNVVTTSIHINVGIEDGETLMRAIRVVRMEAALYLALSASSPFLDSQVTGFHSTRWQIFPKTPAYVPLFTSHNHFINWTEEQLRLGTMQNVRHLWCAVRPNGNRRPYDLNRLELRITDLVSDPIALLAITALLEMRLWMVLTNVHLDPLGGKFTPTELIAIADENERAAARSSLAAELVHWERGGKIRAEDWIRELYEQVYPLACDRGVNCFLSPLLQILHKGNEAQRWLQAYQAGKSTTAIMTEAVAAWTQQDQELAQMLL